MGEIFRLKNKIQNYAWGSHETLGRMRGAPVPTTHPEAEVWVGAHPAAPSVATVDNTTCRLDELVAAQPGRFLRADRTSDWFPFLFKILAIEAPLSIQVHPTDAQAVAGFEAEQARGIPLDAPHRNYKDRHSKPETVIALTPMRILTGVRPKHQLAELAQVFGASWLDELTHLPPKELLAAIIRMPDEHAECAVNELAAAAAGVRTGAQVQTGETQGGNLPRYITDAAELVHLVNHKYPADRGMLVAFVMNLLHLAPGDSVFTPDGQVHAYISGTAIELMNPSDNVMRAGLTPKHIDTEELIKILGENQDAPTIDRPHPDNAAVGTYTMWDARMSVTRIRVQAGETIDYVFEGTSAALVVAGKVSVAGAGAVHVLGGTESVLHAGDNTPATITGGGELYIAQYV